MPGEAFAAWRWWPAIERWTFASPYGVVNGTTVVMPLWMASVPMAAWTALLWRRLLRRRRVGACEACGYDRRGLAGDAACPECGGRV